jgi:hypothetical protein
VKFFEKKRTTTTPLSFGRKMRDTFLFVTTLSHKRTQRER